MAKSESQEDRRGERARNVVFILGFLVVVAALASYALHQGATPEHIALVGFVAFSAVVIAFAAAVLWEIINGNVDLYGIISEPQDVAKIEGKPKASLSRFQFLVFTFVIAGLFLMLSIEAGSFVHIPENVLVLIGLSGGGFVVSKAVGQAKAKGAGGGGQANGGDADPDSKQPRS